MSARTLKLAKLTGILIGAALCLAFVLSGRISDDQGATSLQLTMVAERSQELAVSPTGRFLFAPALKSGPASNREQGTVVIENRAITPLAVRLRARPSTDDLDDVLRLRITAGGKRLFEGPLRELRDGTLRQLDLRPGDRTPVRFGVWIPTTARAGSGVGPAVLNIVWEAQATT